jgi:hypothetical protein
LLLQKRFFNWQPCTNPSDAEGAMIDSLLFVGVVGTIVFACLFWLVVLLGWLIQKRS